MDFAPIAAGDRAAFEALFRLHYRPLCAFATGYVKDADQAEDIVQDLFFRLWLDRAKVTISTSVKAYLYASVRNRCLNAVKTGGRMRVLNERDDRPEEDVRTEDEHTERIARVQAAVPIPGGDPVALRHAADRPFRPPRRGPTRAPWPPAYQRR
jgi:RNA polymerase sigma factor (sigma-70 family)